MTLSRSSVTTLFEVVGFLFLAAAAAAALLLPWRQSGALAVAGLALIVESLILSAAAPKPRPPGSEVG